MSHLTNRTKTKLSKTNLYAYLWCYRSSIEVTRITDTLKITSIKRYGKNKKQKKKYKEKSIRRFLRQEILKAQKRINLGE